MPTIKRQVHFVLFTLVVLASLVAIKLTFQPHVEAQTNPDAAHDQAVMEWQEKITAWQQQQANDSAKTTNLSGQGVMQLPNTGPSN